MLRVPATLTRSLARVLPSLLAAGALAACAAAPLGSDDDDPGADGDAAPGEVDAAPAAPDGAPLAGKNGFPGDFPALTDQGGSGQGQPIIGFGGDTTTDRAGNRAALAHRPVVLLHGNGVATLDARFGMADLAAGLRAAGYVDAELWAPSYLGQDITVAEVSTPQRNNIDDVRDFIDAVLAYLDVERVDVVAHSLGCGMANGYLRGLTRSGAFDPALVRFDRVGTVVCLGGAIYGTGANPFYGPEFDLGSSWIDESLTLDGVTDATPFGSADMAAQVAPASGTLPENRPFRAVTSLDGGARRIHWVALWAVDDVVDASVKNGGGFGGADLNRGFTLPGTFPGAGNAQLARHAELVHDAGVRAAFLPFLDR